MSDQPKNDPRWAAKSTKLAPKIDRRGTSPVAELRAKSKPSSNEKERKIPSHADPLVGSPYSEVGSVMTTSTFRRDPTREKIILCVAGYQLDQNWIKCDAKFDSGSQDDWISKKLATRIGLPSKEAQPLKCRNFDNSIFISDQITDKLTWTHENKDKSICGVFRISEHSSYDIVIGSRTLFREKIFSAGEKAHDSGILVTKRISKEEAEKNRAEAKRQKELSDTLLKKQSEQQKKQEEEALKKYQGPSRRDGKNDSRGASNSRQ